MADDPKKLEQMRSQWQHEPNDLQFIGQHVEFVDVGNVRRPTVIKQLVSMDGVVRNYVQIWGVNSQGSLEPQTVSINDIRPMDTVNAASEDWFKALGEIELHVKEKARVEKIVGTRESLENKDMLQGQEAQALEYLTALDIKTMELRDNAQPLFEAWKKVYQEGIYPEVKALPLSFWGIEAETPASETKTVEDSSEGIS